MFRITIENDAVTERSGEKNGRKWHMRTQVAWCRMPSKPHPVEITITLQDNQAAFPRGEYTLGAESAWVTKFGELRLDLSKIQKAAPAASRPASVGQAV